jgi:hypothetical protein
MGEHALNWLLGTLDDEPKHAQGMWVDIQDAR